MMMIRRPQLGLLLVLLGCANVFAEDLTARLEAGALSGRTTESAFSHGLLSLGFTAQGELGECGPPPAHFEFAHRVVLKYVYSKLDGVCDDQSNRPCQGRLIQLAERCTADDVHYQIDERRALDYARVKFRICFDPSLQGHCEEVDAVASGFGVIQIPGGFHDNPTLPDQFDLTNVSSAVETVQRSKRFKLDGRRVRVRRGARRGISSARVDSACLFEANACPVTNTLFGMNR